MAAGGKAIYIDGRRSTWFTQRWGSLIIAWWTGFAQLISTYSPGQGGGDVVYTLPDPSISETARQACELWGGTCTDILSPVTETITSHLCVSPSPSGLPRWAPGRKNSLSE